MQNCQRLASDLSCHHWSCIARRSNCDMAYVNLLRLETEDGLFCHLMDDLFLPWTAFFIILSNSFHGFLSLVQVHLHQTQLQCPWRRPISLHCIWVQAVLEQQLRELRGEDWVFKSGSVVWCSNKGNAVAQWWYRSLAVRKFPGSNLVRTSPVPPAVKGYPISDSARYCQNASLDDFGAQAIEVDQSLLSWFFSHYSLIPLFSGNAEISGFERTAEIVNS